SGLYEFRIELVRNLLGSNEVYISLPEEPDDKYVKAFAAEGCHMLHTPFERRGMNPIKDIDLFRTYKSLIGDIKPDMVLTYTIKPNIYGGLAAKSLNVSYIANITGLGTAILGGGLLSKVLLCMYRVATSKAKCIFFQNSSNMEFMKNHGVCGSGDVRLLPGSGVNLAAHPYIPYPSEENGIEILSVMRIMKDKGIEELLQAIEELGTPGKQSVGGDRSEDNGLAADAEGTSERVHFSIAGNYEEETRSVYEPQIERLVKEGKLTYLGFVDDMNPIYESCHIIVHPSYHEGLSNVCLEAAACGRPIVTTDIPGCRETVNERSGILCQPKLSESLTESLKKMLDLTPEEREAMGKVGRTHVEKNFDRNIVIKAYREFV
ncbi:MAG: glycosyltransferase family 4 protein, partial [Lachnospiraceae bacterium]|nr:glycosyltransferase family 4 protein [Lachnospiraceae bacterium]